MASEKKKELLQRGFNLNQIEDIATRVHDYLTTQGLHASEEDRGYFEGSPILKRYYSLDDSVDIDYHNATVSLFSSHSRFGIRADTTEYFPGILEVVPELKKDYVNPESLEDKAKEPTEKEWKLTFKGPATPISQEKEPQEPYKFKPRRKKLKVKIETKEERNARLEKMRQESMDRVMNADVIKLD